MNTIEALNRSFAIPGVASIIAGNGDLPCIAITNAHAAARIYLHGAHVTHFQPVGAEPVLWMSGSSNFAPNTPIRGGVPICWPWFGPNAQDPKLPAHGFARTNAWTLSALRAEKNGDSTVELNLRDNETTRALWPHSFSLTLTLRIGRELDMQLTSENTGKSPFTYAEALHTYFTVKDARAIAIDGLQGVSYLDKVSAMPNQVASTAITISGETDRVYQGTAGVCTVHDTQYQRDLVVAKEGSLSTVVWNPWIAKAAAMADFGNDEWPGMVCVETANVLEHAITVAPGTGHTLRATIRIKPH